MSTIARIATPFLIVIFLILAWAVAQGIGDMAGIHEWLAPK